MKYYYHTHNLLLITASKTPLFLYLLGTRRLRNVIPSPPSPTASFPPQLSQSGCSTESRPGDNRGLTLPSASRFLVPSLGRTGSRDWTAGVLPTPFRRRAPPPPALGERVLQVPDWKPSQDPHTCGTKEIVCPKYACFGSQLTLPGAIFVADLKHPEGLQLTEQMGLG